MTTQSLDRMKIRDSFWTDLPKIGITKQALFQKTKLPITILTEPVVVNTEQYFSIWQAVSELVSDPAKAIVQLTTGMHTAQLPPSILAAYHAPDYREALKRMARYKQLCSPERITMVEEDERCTIELEWLYSEKKEPSLLAGYLMANLLQIGRLGSETHIKAQLVEFTHALGNKQLLEDYFGCEVRFGAKHNRMTLLRTDLDRSFISYNAELLAILTPVLDQSLDEHQRRHSITETVKQILKKNLSGGRPDIQTVASELSVSERTLQRRLTDAGTSFKDILSETRREMARDYLLNPALDVKEVAFLLGYEELNSFYRAFRHWEGETPSSWRAEQIGSQIH